MKRSLGAVLSIAAVSVVVVSCGKRVGDLSYTNPRWRETVKPGVSFPLAEPVTITVGLSSRMARPSADNLSLQWLEKRTNVRLQFLGLPESPGDVELGQMVRAGKLPDIVPEARIDLGDGYSRQLFVNVLEFPSLTPRFLSLARADAALLGGSLARTTEKGELYSLGSYRPDSVPYAGVLAYRRDVFDARGLETASWEEITASLVALKNAFPQSAPFGGSFDAMLKLMPSWFGSGYDADNVVYYDPDRASWRFGPDEEPFRDFVAFLADLYGRGILNPDVFVGQEDLTTRQFSTGSCFMAPWRGSTGPFFRYYGGEYGKLTPEGEWDGSGAWVESLALPERIGVQVRAGAPLHSRVGAGWLVYNQSPRVAEALALLDLMYDPEVSLVMALGPEGTAWERSGGKLGLTGALRESYDSGGRPAVLKALASRGAVVGLDLGGMEWSVVEALGLPAGPSYRYYELHDVAANLPGRMFVLEPGIRVPRDSAFRDARAGTILSLQTAIESGVAGFAVGRKPMSDYDAFRVELAKAGSGKLLELYRTRAVVVDPGVILGR